MKQKLLLKTMLLLFALIAGSSSAWAETSTLNFTAKCNGSGTADDGVKWTVTSNGTESTFDSTSGIHYGTSSAEVTYVQLSTSGISGTIKKVVVNARDAQAKATVSVTVGGTAFTCSGSAKATNTSADYTFTGSGTGEIVVKVDRGSSMKKAIYVKSVVVTYESSDPSSNASFANTTPSINYPATNTYSQTATTATGYTGTITYSMTANTAGATIDANSGKVTVTKGGEVTVKATAPAVSGFTASQASYTLTVNDTRASAGLAWSATSANVTYGADNNIFPTLTNPNGVSVTYSSSNTNAATISSSGVITLKDVTAATTISAIFAGNDDYKDQTVTYELNVTAAPFSIQDGIFDFVKAGGASEDYGSGISTTADGSYYDTSVATWVAGNVTMVTSGKYRWWNADNTLRFYANTPNSAMKFSVPDGFVITKIVLTGGQNFEAEGYSSGTWKGAQQTVTLSYTAESGSANVKTATVYYSEPTINVTMGSEGYMTYCNKNAALSFGDLEAYVVSAVGSDNVTLTKITEAPANTPVVLKGSAGSHNLTVLESASAVETNKLYCSNGTVANNDSRNVYALAKKGDPAVVGFYKLKDGVKVPEGKCYISVNKSSSAPEFFGLGGDGNTTGMNDVRSKMEEGRGEFYNLNGQRAAQPTKGLYIVNGKKYVVK